MFYDKKIDLQLKVCANNCDNIKTVLRQCSFFKSIFFFYFSADY